MSSTIYQNWHAPFYAHASGQRVNRYWWVNWGLWEGPGAPGPRAILMQPKLGLARCELTEVSILGNRAVLRGVGKGYPIPAATSPWYAADEDSWPVQIEIELVQKQFGEGTIAMRVLRDGAVWMTLGEPKLQTSAVYLRDLERIVAQ